MKDDGNTTTVDRGRKKEEGRRGEEDGRMDTAT